MGFHSVGTGKGGAVNAVAVLDPLVLARIELLEGHPAQIASTFFAVFCPTKIQSDLKSFAWSGW